MHEKESYPKLLNVPQMAELLGISSRTIYNRVRPGSDNPFPIKAKRVLGRTLRFDREEVFEYLESA